MKVLCPVCGKLAEAKDVQSGPEGLSWTCGACGQQVSESAEETQSEAEKEKDAAGGTTRCPKCGAPRTDRPDCPRCGLVFERWNPAAGLELVPALEAAWEELLDSYEDEAAHERFLDTAHDLGRLDLAAAYYRARAAEHEEDRVAARQVERIATMVQFEALVPRQRHQLVSPTFVWAMRIVLGVLVLVGLYYVFTFSVPPPRPVQGGGMAPSMGSPSMGSSSVTAPPGAGMGEKSPVRPGRKNHASSRSPAPSRR